MKGSEDLGGGLTASFNYEFGSIGANDGTNGDNRTLYSLRHTYATLEMLRGEVDMHTLGKQMGNSAAMIERHYSKLTATMAAERLA